MTAGPLTIALQPTAHGAQLTSDDPALKALTYVVNAAFGDVLEGLPAAVADRRPMSSGELFAIPGAELADRSARAESWRRLTGADPGDDVYLVGAGFLDQALIVPRAVLLDLLRQLGALRAV